MGDILDNIRKNVRNNEKGQKDLSDFIEQMLDNIKKVGQEENKEEPKNDMWLLIFLSILAFGGNHEDITLKQEVAYLRGKIDVLEKIILKEGE